MLISSAGRRVELINCFRHAAEKLGQDVVIFAADMDPDWSPACQTADQAFKVPACTDPGFIRCMLNICQNHRIDLIVPTVDTELLVYVTKRQQFAEIDTDIHLSSEKFVEVARDKHATAKILGEQGVFTPATWTIEEASAQLESLQFPILMKPVNGSCSKGIQVIHSHAEFREKDFSDDHYILQAICRGREYTINCFYDNTGRCVACIPHFRKMVRAGEVCFAETVRIPEFKKIGDRLGQIFSGIRGCICFQGYRNQEGQVSIFEINARFGGGYPICDYAGGSFARWILQELAGEAPDYHDEWQAGVRMLRYDAAVYMQSD